MKRKIYAVLAVLMAAMLLAPGALAASGLSINPALQINKTIRDSIVRRTVDFSKLGMPSGEEYVAYANPPKGKALNVWAESSLEGAVKATMPYGMEMVIQDYLGGYSLVVATVDPGDPTDAEGGFVRTADMVRMHEENPVAEGEPYQAQVTTSGGDLNLWAAYTLTGKIYSSVSNGTIFPWVQNYRGGYSYVEITPEESCYVRTKYLTKIGPAIELPYE